MKAKKIKNKIIKKIVISIEICAPAYSGIIIRREERGGVKERTFFWLEACGQVPDTKKHLSKSPQRQ